jgi:ATP-dependent DNA helicase RecQ
MTEAALIANVESDMTGPLVETLRRQFSHDAFRPGQEAVVRCALDGHDLLAVMPTGSGKSICYQLPAVILPGLTLVISPLISLMKDQVGDLHRRGIPAGALYAAQPEAERRSVLDATRAGGLRLLYVAPERFASPRFTHMVTALPLARFVIDEAHCVSSWGHDFRPDYRRLSGAALACRRSDGAAGRPPMLAFTATATPEVRDDIVSLLGLHSPRTFVSGFDRPNIELRVAPVSGDIEKFERLPALVGSRRALVYGATRRRAEEVSGMLVTAGIASAPYHAGLSERERSRVQDDFASGRLQAVCATNAFGMGIDRPDIDAVIHVDIPGSVEAYYQEVGRGGRDGRPAIATLLWNFADVRTREFLIDKAREDDPDRPRPQVDPAELARRRELDHLKLRRMISYAETSGCLRATILRYFGDPAAREPCDGCGNCLSRERLDPGQVLLVRKILSGIARAGERYGKRRIAAMLVGAVEDLPAPLTGLSTTGLLRDHEARFVERWIDTASAGGLIRVSADKYRTLGLTRLGRDVMAGRATEVALLVPRSPNWSRRGSKRRRRRRGGLRF